MSHEQEETDEEDRECRQKDAEEAARDTEHRLDRVGHRRRDRLGPRLDVLRSAGVAKGVELSGVAQALYRRRQVLEVVAHASDERSEQQEREQRDRNSRSQYGHRGREPARHVRPRHHEAHRILEDEPEEDAYEDDKERVADRPEGRQHANRRRDEQDRPHGQHQLDSPSAAWVHSGEAYAAERRDPGALSGHTPILKSIVSSARGERS